MNQTQKRLKIINLAISITDIDTIQLQILKLNQIKMDEKLKEIINTLDSNNYAKAQTLIQNYLDNPPVEEIIQRVENQIFESEVANLYDQIDERVPAIEIQLDDMLKIQNEGLTTQTETFSTQTQNTEFDSLLDLQLLDEENEHQEFVVEEPTLEDTIPKYPPIAYINDKFQNIKAQYPQTQASLENYDSVNRWLEVIENDGYDEDNVEEIINYMYKVSQTNISEASELLLLTACTKSKYAQFILARELYRGRLLKQNIPEAFDKMSELAINEKYPEAMCDLAQFYEYGIGVKQDKKEALRLYDQAMQLGITRAIKHYEKLSKQKKSLLGLF